MFKINYFEPLPLVTALAIAFYFFGSVSYQSYLFSLGVENTLFPLTFDRTWYEGFVCIMTLLSVSVGYIFLTSLVVVDVALLAVLLSSIGLINDWVKRVSSKFVHKPRIISPSENTMALMINAIKVAGFCGFLMGSTFLIIVIAISAEWAGKERASDFIQTATKSKDGFVTICLTESTKPIIGKSIICGTSHCAYWVKQETVVLRYENIKKIISHKTLSGDATENKCVDS